MFTALKLPDNKALKDQPKSFYANLLSAQVASAVQRPILCQRVCPVTALTRAPRRVRRR